MPNRHGYAYSRSHRLRQDEPWPFVKGIKEETRFHGNRLITDSKGESVWRCYDFPVTHEYRIRILRSGACRLALRGHRFVGRVEGVPRETPD